ncbi:MAG TPA: CPBP family intramembrane glutamic endopeptidase [Pyrinomonadaceae bacterium]|nr:CPBP family intramembrane glutamic endopeptidase [Pyrinomonadaceae bacterium]
MTRHLNARRFWILFTAGFIGILSFLLVDLSALVALFPVPPGTQIPPITVVKLLSVIQPALLLALAVFSGVMLAQRVGLSSPFAEALVTRQPAGPALKAQLLPAVVGGAIGGAAILVLAAVSKSMLTADVIQRLHEFGNLLPLPTRLLYGGLTEELLLRWGLMTLLVWAIWRLVQRRQPKPTTATFVAAILLSSLVFAVGHLPITIMLVGERTFSIIFFVVLANSAFGLVAGYLYWKYGLESAMIAHMLVHVVLVAATKAGAYF